MCYRWKGENVATYEVSNILTKLDFVHDANVYGVEIPGQYIIVLLYYHILSQHMRFWHFGIR